MKLFRPIRGLWLRMQVDGIAPTLRGVLDGFTPKVWNIYRHGTRELGLPAGPSATAASSPLAIDSDLTRLAALRRVRPGLASEYFRDEARRATRCFFSVANNRLSGIVWILDAAHPSRVIRLGRADVELAFLYVEPEFRGRGIARALVQHACRVLPTEGVTGIYSIIEQHNVASQKAFLSSGFEQVAALRRPVFVGPRYDARKAT